MAYKATRNNDPDKEEEKARANDNNTRNVRNAADVAIASGNPYAMAAGATVKGLDRISGGRASEAIGKGMTTANRIAPGGRSVQNLSNNLSESGASDTVGTVASVKNRIGGNSGGEQESLPSSVDKSGSSISVTASSTTSEDGRKSSSRVLDDESRESKNDDKGKEETSGTFSLSPVAKTALVVLAPMLIIILLLFVIVIAVAGSLSNFEDAVGINQLMGEETSGIEFNTSSPEKKSFYERINDVKLSYQAQGKNVDVLKIVGTFQVLNTYGANLKYDDMTTDKIELIVNAMFDTDNTYNQDVFKKNLVNSIIPTYLKGKSTTERETIADDIIKYSDEYNSLIGKETTNNSTCGTINTCSYDIKGFSVTGKGNVSKNLQVKDVYVQQMQCNSSNAISGETAIPFEKYILGVMYYNNSESSSGEAVKAQAVSLRSSLMAGQVASNSVTLTQDGNRWILKVPACNSYTYCDPDKGCSKDNSGLIHSGTSNGTKVKDALSTTSSLKSYVNSTAGEMLSNSSGYVIFTSYKSNDLSTFNTLAQNGLDYKQILLQAYGQSLSASNILKNSCTTSTASCISSGEFANWRQGDSAWGNIQMGNSVKNIRQIGCLVTSIAMLIVKSGVPTNIADFNPGTFVQYLNTHGGFYSGGNLSWSGPEKAAPSFKYAGSVNLSGKSRDEKLSKISQIVGQSGVYAVVEVKGNTGQHWVAIDSVTGSTINMMDPSSSSTDMWSQYNWQNTSRIVYFKVS